MKVCKVFGFTFSLDVAEWIQRQIYYGTFEPEETETIRAQLRPGMTFVDVGANVGYYTALAASLVGPKGSVIAFEPSPYAFEGLRHMVETNKLDYVKIVQAGLSDRTGRLRMYLGVGARNHSPTMVPHGNTTQMEVPVTLLDSAIEEMGVSQIDLMKIDVEGHEPRVLAGGQKLLNQGRIRAILCEFNDDWLAKSGSSAEGLEAQITGAGLVEVPMTSSGRGVDNRFFLMPQ